MLKDTFLATRGHFSSFGVALGSFRMLFGKNLKQSKLKYETNFNVPKMLDNTLFGTFIEFHTCGKSYLCWLQHPIVITEFSFMARVT